MSKTILNVERMSCPSAALALRGVGSVDVLLEEGAVAIEHDTSVPIERLIAALENAGYEVRPRDQRGNV